MLLKIDEKHFKKLQSVIIGLSDYFGALRSLEYIV